MLSTIPKNGVTAPEGFKASAVHSGIRKNKTKLDLALIYSKAECDAAAVYTKNQVKAAPILVTRENLKSGKARAIICNSGNANACTADGIEKAELMCRLTAEQLHISPSDVIVASTGVIGVTLPEEPLRYGIPLLAKELGSRGGSNAARAIMTTDTTEKEHVVHLEIEGKTCTIGGCAKGSGMIHPNMATMLAFLTTDVAIDSALLHKALQIAAEVSFNMISVDRDTSTNDMACILANGMAGNTKITSDTSPEFMRFSVALTEICKALARMIAADGEGATKLLTCKVSGAKSRKEARELARSVISSNLVKAAMFGADANWGRVLCALGYSYHDIDPANISVAFSSEAGCVRVCEKGMGIDFSEKTAKKVLSGKEVIIEVRVGRGHYSAESWGCDLTYDYVKINGDYRT